MAEEIMWESMEIGLVVIAGIVLVIVVGLWLGGYTYLNELFNKLSGNLPSSMNISTASLKALACAIHSVDKKENQCEGILFTQGEDLFTTQETYVECTEPGSENFKCRVVNFRLPQKFIDIDPRVWIEGFGDPRYVAVFQNLEEGEDAPWSGWSAWMRGMRTTSFLTLCITNIAFSFIPFAKAAPKAMIKAAFSGKVLSKSAKLLKSFTTSPSVLKNIAKTSKEAVQWGSFLAREYGKIPRILLSRNVMIELIKYNIKNKLSKRVIENSFNIFTTYSKKAGIKTLITIGASKAAQLEEYADKRIKTEFGKFIPVPGKLILYEPTNIVEVDDIRTQVSSNSEGIDITREGIFDLAKPILLQKDGKLVQFHSESPCRADYVVWEESVRCEVYEYDESSGFVICKHPSKGDDEPRCSSIFADLSSKDFPGEEIRVLKDMGNYIIFEDENHDGRWDVIKDPIDNVTIYFEWKNESEIKTDDGNWYGGTITKIDFSRNNYKEWRENDVLELEDKYTVCKDDTFVRFEGIKNIEGIENYFSCWIQNRDIGKDNIVYKNIFTHSKEEKRAPGGISTIIYIIGIKNTTCDFCGWKENGKYIQAEVEINGEKLPVIVSGSDREDALKMCEDMINTTKGEDFLKMYRNNIFVDRCKNYDNFNGIVIEKVYKRHVFPDPFPHYQFYQIFLIDNNGDGKIDLMAHTRVSQRFQGIKFWIFDPKWYRSKFIGDGRYAIFDDTDLDGLPDHFISSRCVIDAIKVTADKTAYENEKYNFCYGKGETLGTKTLEITKTLGLYMAADMLKAIPVVGWIASAGAYCGIGIMEAKSTGGYWPKS